MRYVLLILMLIGLQPYSCSQATDSRTVYETSYTLHLDALPENVPLDSAVIDVYVGGKLDTVIRIDSAGLLSGEIPFMVTTEPGENIRIDYRVYSGAQAVANGSDSFDPEVPSESPGALQVDSTVLRDLQALLSSSSISGMSGSSSQDVSSSSTPAENENFTVEFEVASSTLYEDSVEGTMHAPYVKIRLNGNENSKLLAARTLAILRVGGTADAGDFTLLASVNFPKNSVSGATKNLSLGILSDDLVEGDETLVLSIGDAQDLGVGTNATHTVTIHDADSAWVEFGVDSIDVPETAGDVSVGIRLRTLPATATLETPVSVRAAFDEEEAQEGIDFTYTSSTSSAIFAAGSGDTDPKAFSVTVIDDEVRELIDWFHMSLQVTSGPATAGGILSGASHYLKFGMANDDFEYVAVVDTQQHYLMFYAPEGSYVNRYYDVRIDGKTGGIAARPNGNVLITDDAGVLQFNVSTKTFSMYSNSATKLTDIAEWEGSDSLWGISQDSLVWISKNSGVKVGRRPLSHPGDNANNFVAPAATYSGAFTASYYNGDMEGSWGMIGFHSKMTVSENRYGEGMLYKPVGFASDGATTAYILTSTGFGGSFQLVKYPLTLVATSLDVSAMDLVMPRGMALSSRGSLYVVDGKAYGTPSTHYRLLEYDPVNKVLIKSSKMEEVVDHFELGGDIAYVKTHAEVPVAP